MGGLSDKDVEKISKEVAEAIFALKIRGKVAPANNDAIDKVKKVMTHMSKEVKEQKSVQSFYARSAIVRSATWLAMDWRIHDLVKTKKNEKRVNLESFHLFCVHKVEGFTRLELLQRTADEKTKEKISRIRAAKRWEIKWEKPRESRNTVDLNYVWESIKKYIKAFEERCDSPGAGRSQARSGGSPAVREGDAGVFEGDAGVFFVPRVMTVRRKDFYISPDDFLRFYLPYYFLTRLRSLDVDSSLPLLPSEHGEDAYKPTVKMSAFIRYECVYSEKGSLSDVFKDESFKKGVLNAVRGIMNLDTFKYDLYEQAARLRTFLTSVRTPTPPTPAKREEDASVACRRAACACVVFFFHCTDDEDMKLKWRSKPNNQGHKHPSGTPWGEKDGEYFSARVTTMENDVGKAAKHCSERVWECISGDARVVICGNCNTAVAKEKYLPRLIEKGPEIALAAGSLISRFYEDQFRDKMVVRATTRPDRKDGEA